MMKIYTKKGDSGSTSLLGGTRVNKDDLRVEAYGSSDELLAHIGLIRDLLPSEKENLIKIQNSLFDIGSHLANDQQKSIKLNEIKENEISFLEEQIDKMDASLPPLSNFILPGGHTTVSQIHIARTVCRRVERNIVKIQNEIPANIIKYINRLSDYLFVLARFASKELNAEEIIWKPNNK